MQARLLKKGGDDSALLEPADRFLLFHLAMQHPNTALKLKAPVRAIRYGVHHHFPNAKCFMLVFEDGEMEPISWAKCVKEVCAPGYAERDRAKRAREAAAGKAAAKRRKTAEGQAGEREEEEDWGPVTEASRKETGLKLIREDAASQGHPLAGRWSYPLMDEEYRCFAGHMACPLADLSGAGGAKPSTDAFYRKVEAGTRWDQPLDPRSGEPIPRRTAWMVAPGCTCTYRYGGVDVAPQDFPDWMVEIMEVYMPLCGLTKREEWPNSCNLNLYEDGAMSVGWHADDEKLFQGRWRDIRIISVSLGETRTFELRTIAAEDGERAKYKMRLGDGDICTMEGLTQKHYSHRVPKEDANGPRINLTWRWVRKHMEACPCKK
mmetsp:Transcript_35309/g.104903  ORF Transcript_35309/g.104903 Transcript_35309/m.104903 type:complete len:377 (-) Transcript_35309:13-1143(-)